MQFSNLQDRLKRALKEDGAFHDITTRQLPGFGQKKASAILLAKENGIFSGGILAKPLFTFLDRGIRIQKLTADGSRIKKGQKLAILQGKTSAILAGERTFLNLACHLSGISTLTSRFVQAVNGSNVKILDTRKTMPLWRDLEKYAVLCGGGENHRMTLAEAILVKDNHLKYLSDRKLQPAVVYSAARLKKEKKKKFDFLEVEAKTYAEVWEGIKARADIILLDNMSKEKLEGSIEFIKAARKALDSDKPLIEISGGVNLKNVKSFAQMGIDRISIGSLTHSAPALDISLEII